MLVKIATYLQKPGTYCKNKGKCVLKTWSKLQ